MITALSIRSFLLIDQLDLDCCNGFTALTGETGAGKSIILDALALVMGGPADRGLIRRGSDAATISAEFFVPPDHDVMDVLGDRGIEIASGEAIVLRRMIFAERPSRAFINDQSVSAATLELVGSRLVDIHGQHAASGLMRPSTHRSILDAFAGNDERVSHCKSAWDRLEQARAVYSELEAQATKSEAEMDWLEHAIAELSELCAEPGEASKLAAERAVLLQTEKLTENIDEAATALSCDEIEDGLSRASRASERVARLLEPIEGDLLQTARAAADAIERTLIELAEAQAAISALADQARHDAGSLDRIEARLFAIRAAGRKYEAEPDELDQLLSRFSATLEAYAESDAALAKARAEQDVAMKAWQSAADALTKARLNASKSLPDRIAKELAPLHLGRVQVRVRIDPIEPGESGASGQERVFFEAETNPGAGFGSLQAIASGGELARFSLALQCALSQSDKAATLIFDEADQGVGGAVAAAIGERLAKLSGTCQVFAITHSPQVASHADRQWRVRKTDQDDGSVTTMVSQLNDGERLEEIARMLSGSSVTDEARAAASKLLEAA